MPDPLRLQALIQECARGQESALAELYRQTSPHLFALAVRILRRSDWAEEVLQDSFINIWRNAARYSSEQSQVMTWMTRIVRNRCIDLLRRPDLERPDADGALTLAWADDAPGPFERLQRDQDGQRLAEVFAGFKRRADEIGEINDAELTAIIAAVTAQAGASAQMDKTYATAG